MRNTGDTFPDIFPLRRYHLLPRLGTPSIVLSCLVLHLFACIYCFFPLFSPVDYETDAAAAQFDYGVDDPSLWPEQPGKPPP